MRANIIISFRLKRFLAILVNQYLNMYCWKVTYLHRQQVQAEMGVDPDPVAPVVPPVAGEVQEAEGQAAGRQGAEHQGKNAQEVRVGFLRKN